MITMGVKQGCLLSPTLFDICNDKPQGFIQESLESTRIKTNCCAIDGVLTAYSQLTLQKYFEMVHTLCENSGLMVNLNPKTKVLVVSAPNLNIIGHGPLA